MATAGDGKLPYVNGGAGEKRPFQPGSSGVGQTLKQHTFIRFKMQHPATIENLPDEILLNIFIRLLAKQLAQMRSVSKSWNAMLSHPSFVKSHLHRSICNNNNRILLVFSNYHEPFTQYSCQSPRLQPTKIIKHTPTNLPMNVVGSVNGLICLSEICYSVFRIWNPSLSAMSTIPPPHFLPHNLPCVAFVRFGFDPKTDDYKIVKISGVRDASTLFRVKEWLQVQVYSVRNRSWEWITQPFPSHITWIYDTDDLFVDGHDGHLHWENRTATRREQTIVAFDLCSETFHEIPLPNSILDYHHGVHRLGVLGGKLCEMLQRVDGELEVWVMEEYGMPESWVKRHVIPKFNGVWRYLFGFTLRNELVIKDKHDRLVLNDPIANKTKKSRKKPNARRVLEYVDSLVWV